MKKIALVFVLAVFVPSLVLAWLAVRSLRDQQLILERQQSLLYQGVADALAKEADGFLADEQHDFGQQVETLLAGPDAQNLKVSFDNRLRTNWPYAEVGFVVALNNGQMLSPSPTANFACATFVSDFGKFLGNRESAEVYYNNYTGNNSKLVAKDNNFENNSQPYSQSGSQPYSQPGSQPYSQPGSQPYSQPGSQPYSQSPANVQLANTGVGADNQGRANNIGKGLPQKNRNVVPMQNGLAQNPNEQQQLSKVASSEAEFRQLVGDANEGTVARFVENKLKVLLWHRSSRDTNLVFGAQLSLPRLKESLMPIVDGLDAGLRGDIAVALLDDMARPVAVTPAGFQANWKRPFVATEIGESLPHWEMAVYLLNPARLAESARTLKLTLGLLISVLIIAIGVGGWLIVTDLNRQLTLARQKTDFVSNVSHELKTPLTSIRMFSELLAEGRVAEPAKRQTYLNIITAETSRLTRLINNVLDFSRLERGEKKYNFQSCDLAALARETVEIYRPNLESAGFTIRSEAPGAEITINGDRDALAQILVNLLSNAEKYSNGAKEITVQIDNFINRCLTPRCGFLTAAPACRAAVRKRYSSSSIAPMIRSAAASRVPASG